MPTHAKKKKKGHYALFFIIAAFILLSLWGAWSAYSLLSDLPDPRRINERDVVESTKIFDRTGAVLLYEIHGEERRTVIGLDDIPDAVRYATLAAEDLYFYRHIGIDFRGIARAFVKNLTRGNISQGGSTITQQLIKKSLLSDERTYTRKLKEIFLALLLERKYSKNEILELYLNQIPYGSNAYGIAAAAQTFFSKEAKDLTLEEAALLAALPNAPTYYSPYGAHKEALLERKDWILDRVAEANFINKDQIAQAKEAAIRFSPPKQSIRAPHFVMYVREYLNQKYGEDFVERGGLRVITTLDWKLQEGAERIVREGAEQNEKLVRAKNAALVAIDPKTGEILTMVGSRDYFDLKNDGNVNVTTRPRQPGSAFKPFVYATAFKKGYTPETVLFDVPTEFNSSCNPDGSPGPLVEDEKTCYHPRNYDGNFRGPVDLRHAIAQSLNIPSIKLLYLAGINDVIKTAKDFGITTLTDPERYGLSLVLGGAEVTLLEMTSGFGVFAQDGILHAKTGILKIENSHGVTLEEKRDSATPVIDSEIAQTINDVLSDNDARVPMFNPRSSLYFPARKVAAKTGTTQDFRDAWVVGYTPSLVAGVWVGNNDNAPMEQGGVSVMVAGPLWHKFMELALESQPPEEFTRPAKQAPAKPILRGIYQAGPIITIDKLSRKLATAYTPPELIEEISLGETKTILAQVKKNDPLGLPPLSPSDDPQFHNWQAGIDSWLASHAPAHPVFSQALDDLHTPERRPHISFTSWTEENPSIKSISVVSVEVTSSFPLREISFFINDTLQDSKTAPIIASHFSFRLEKSLPQGTHRIKIVAYDAVGNKETKEATITVTE